MGAIRFNRHLNRALYFAALEKAAAAAKESDKDSALKEIGNNVDHQKKYEVKNGQLIEQTRTEQDLNISATITAIQNGKLSLDLLLQHLKPAASLKVVIGEAMASELLNPRPSNYWMLKPTEAIKKKAAESFAEFTE